MLQRFFRPSHARLRATLWASTFVLAGTFVFGQVQQIPARGNPAGPNGGPTPPPTGVGLIMGQVVEGDSTRGVGGAIVTLTGTASAPAAGPTQAGARGAAPNGQVNLSIPARRVMSDADGRFVFRDLPKGVYNLSAQATGFQGGSFGQRRPGGNSQQLELSDGERVANAPVRLWRFGIITGVVTDEAGEPVIGVQVRALRRVMSGGRTRLNGASQATTDDRGAYRITNLSPGDYVLVMPTTQTTMPVATIDAYQQAMQKGGQAAQEYSRAFGESQAPFPDSSGTRVGNFVLQQTNNHGGRSVIQPPPSSDGRVFAYPTVFFPEATTSARATAITLGTGEERPGLDFHLRLVPTMRISGTVTGPDGPYANIGLHLLPADSDDQATYDDVATTVSDPQGGFMFLGVPSGNYIVRATRVPRPTQVLIAQTIVNGVATFSGRGGGPLSQPQPPAEPTLWANVPVSASDSDVTGFAINLRVGLKVAGRVQFDGASPKPTPQQMQTGNILSMSPVDVFGFNGPNPGIRLDADGTFTSSGGFPPGRYTLSSGRSFAIGQANGSGGQTWTVKSITANGKDVSDVPLDLDGDISGVVVTFTDRPAQLSGMVHGSTGSVDSSAAIVLLSADPQSWIGAGGLHNRTTMVSTYGIYNFGRLPPGDYVVFAVPEDRVRDVQQDPKLIQNLAPLGTRVRLGDGEKHTVDLSTLTVR